MYKRKSIKYDNSNLLKNIGEVKAKIS